MYVYSFVQHDLEMKLIKVHHLRTKYPIIAGHEVLGEIVAIGPNVHGWKLGDRAGGAWHGGNDGNCKACARGMPQVCKNLEVNGVTRDGGCTYFESPAFTDFLSSHH